MKRGCPITEEVSCSQSQDYLFIGWLVGGLFVVDELMEEK
jgi:hypothetical protein